jgi:cyclic-di-GMP phosphodiesterase TipF (flagellum assembly factor)
MKITLSLTPSRRKALILGLFGVLVAGFAGVLVSPPYALPLAILLAGGALLGASFVLDATFRREFEKLLAILGEFKVRHAQLKMRLDGLEQRVDSQPMAAADAAPARAQLAELTAEVGILGGLLQNVAQTLGAHEERIARADEPAVTEPPAQAAPASPTARSASSPSAASPSTTAQSSAAQSANALGRIEPAMLDAPEPDSQVSARHREQEASRSEAIAGAIAAASIEIHLQPVVQLPARRTVGYEALARLRLSENELLLPAEFLPVVEERGLSATLDALVLTRVLAIARFLSARPGDLFVSCNISASTWVNARSVASIGKLIENYRDFSRRLVLEMPQRVFRSLDPASLGLIGGITAAGARFALDQLSDLRLDPRGLADRGVRFVKAPMSLLVAARDGRHPLEIDIADLPALLERAGVTLIGEKVEDDRAAAELIDMEVAFGQGLAFAPPRPARPEVFMEPTAQSLEQPVAPPAAPAPAPEPGEGQERRSFRSVLRRASA